MKSPAFKALLLAISLIVVTTDARAQTAKEYCNRGVAKQNRGDIDGALADYNRAIQLNPYDAIPYNNRGLIKAAKGDLDGAIDDFNRALKISPTNPEAYDSRGLAIQKTGDLDGALQNYDRAIDLSRKFARAYAHRGYIKMTKGDLDGALTDYNSAIELRLKDADAFYNRGLVKKAKGDVDGAQADFSRATKLNPKLAGAHSDLPVVNEAKKDAGKPAPDQNHTVNVDSTKTEAPNGSNVAKQTNTEPGRAPADPTAFDIEPRNIVPPTMRDIAKQQASAPKTTPVDSGRTAESKPKSETASKNPSPIAQSNDKLARGITDFGRDVHLNPETSSATNRAPVSKITAQPNTPPDHTLKPDSSKSLVYNNQASVENMRPDGNSASADHDLPIDAGPNFAVTYTNDGNTKRANHDLEAALNDYNRAIELDPTYALAYYNRGLTKQTKGDLDGALADYNPAIELDPKNAAAYGNRAVVKQMKGDLEGALADYSHAIELNPQNAASYNNRAALYFLAQNWSAALEDYNRLLKVSNQGQNYPRLYVWLIRQRMGQKDAANKELTDYLDQRGNASRNDWYSNVASFLLGKASEVELLAMAKIPDSRNKTGHLCEAWFYIGMKKLLADDKTGAEACLKASLDTNQQEYTEYHFAEAELKALQK